jgi:hypothetical protein
MMVNDHRAEQRKADRDEAPDEQEQTADDLAYFMGSKLLRLQMYSSLRFSEIASVDFESDKLFHATSLRGHGGIPDTKKRIEHGANARHAVQFYAPLGELHRKRRRMRSLLCAALDCFVRNKPGIAAATQIAATRVRPTRDVTFVLIRNPEREAIDFNATRLREMKNIFVAIV